MRNGGHFPRGKEAGAWSWAFTSNWCRCQENVDLYIHSPTSLHGIVSQVQGQIYRYLIRKHMRLLHYATIRCIIAILSLFRDILTLLLMLSKFHFLHHFRVNILLTSAIIHLTTVVFSKQENSFRDWSSPCKKTELSTHPTPSSSVFYSKIISVSQHTSYFVSFYPSL
jgi:hypothetical protein